MIITTNVLTHVCTMLCFLKKKDQTQFNDVYSIASVNLIQMNFVKVKEADSIKSSSSTKRNGGGATETNYCIK